MSRTQRHIKSQSNTINEVSYANLQRPTITTFIPEKTMERNAKTKSIQQTSEVVYVESALVKNKETKGQTKKKSVEKNMEDEAVGYA